MPVADVEVEFAPPGSDPHTVRFREDGKEVRIHADWVVDSSGRGKVLKRQLGLAQANPIRHGASFTWVDGLVDIEKLTDRSPAEIRRNPNRAETGHIPLWLATNHFMGEGFWFWVIPLQGKTSLGLVYDNRLLSRDQFTTPEKLIGQQHQGDAQRGSLTTSPASGAAHTTASMTSRSSGRFPPSPSGLSISAQISTRPSLANSDGSTWNPPGRLIHALAPLTDEPSGLSTASRASSVSP